MAWALVTLGRNYQVGERSAPCRSHGCARTLRCCAAPDTQLPCASRSGWRF
jgi:hypothetical protein